MKTIKSEFFFLLITSLLLIGLPLTLMSCGEDTSTTPPTPTPTNTGVVIISFPTDTPTTSPALTPTPDKEELKVLKEELWSYYYSTSPAINQLSIILKFGDVGDLNINDMEILKEDNPDFPFSDFTGQDWIKWEQDPNFPLSQGLRFTSSDSVLSDTNSYLDLNFDNQKDLSAYFHSGLVLRLHLTDNGTNLGYINVHVSPN